MVPVHWSNRGRAATIEPLNQASHRSRLSLLWFWPAMETLLVKLQKPGLFIGPEPSHGGRRETQDREYDNQLQFCSSTLLIRGRLKVKCRELSNMAFK